MGLCETCEMWEAVTDQAAAFGVPYCVRADLRVDGSDTCPLWSEAPKPRCSRCGAKLVTGEKGRCLPCQTEP